MNKYTTTTELYNSKVIHDIMYNELSQVVSVFKDYLILDDLTEFLKRTYDEFESQMRLPKILKFYFSYYKLKPTYAILPENEIFKNLARRKREEEESERQLKNHKK